MTDRTIASNGRLTALVALVLVASLAAACGGGTDATTEGEGAASASRTPWGDPDLQGIWTNATITPLQRPERFAGKEFLTEEEAASVERETAAARVDRPPDAGDVGTYNQLWFDRGQRVVTTRRSSLIIDPADGRIPWTPEAQRANASADESGRGEDYWNDYTDLDTGERCLTDGLPHMPYAYNNNYQIVQTPGYVVILHEMFNEVRAIPVDGRPHADAKIRQWFGDSRGRWEGNTLIIETTNFNDRRGYRWSADWRVTRPTMRLTERLTRIDATTLDYQFTMEDETLFSKPWTASVPMTTDQGSVGATEGQIFEYACHEGNYSVVNVLSGARAKERQAARGR